MDQKVFFSDAGIPKPGLSPVWRSLQRVSDGTDFTPQPAISEIDDAGNADGSYKFAQPVITEDLVGVIDGDPGAIIGLADIDRYVWVNITPDDFGLTDLLDAITKGSQVLDPTGDTLTLKRRDGSTVLVTFDLVKTSESIGAYIERTP